MEKSFRAELFGDTLKKQHLRNLEREKVRVRRNYRRRRERSGKRSGKRSRRRNKRCKEEN